MGVKMAALTAAVIFVVLQLSHSEPSHSEPQNNDFHAKLRLYKRLLTDYDPTIDPGNGTIVDLRVGFICAHLDENTYILTSRLLELFAWTDSRLGWNPDEYDGIRKASVRADRVWTPDLRLLNPAHHSEDRDLIRAKLRPNNTVYHVPPVVYKTWCEPSAEGSDSVAHCLYQLGSWTYDVPNIPLRLYDVGYTMEFYNPLCPYSVKNVVASIEKVKYPCCLGTYNHLAVKFDVERNPNHPIHSTGSYCKK